LLKDYDTVLLEETFNISEANLLINYY